MANDRTPAIAYPITQAVRTQLAASRNLLAATQDQRLNDRDHLGDLVSQMDALAAALLSAGNERTSFLVPVADGATFEMGPHSVLYAQLGEVTQYLMAEGPSLVTKPRQHFDSELSQKARRELLELVAATIAAILAPVRRKLVESAQKDVGEIFAIVDAVTAATSQDVF